MSINFGLVGTRGLLVAALVGGLLAIKALVVWALCRMTGRGFAESTNAALLLAQAGEFGFIMFGLANMGGIIDGDLYQLLLLITALSMAATPLLVRLSPWIGKALDRPAPHPVETTRPIPASRNHVIIAGFGRFGNFLAHSLAKARVPYLVLETDPVRVARAQALDYPVYYGDASRAEVLRAAGAEHALLVVFAMNQMESIGQAVVTAHGAFPALQIYARAWDIKMAEKLLSMGAAYAIPETLESSQQLTRNVLLASGVEADTVTRLVSRDPEGDRYRVRQAPGAADRRSGYRQILLVMTPGCDESSLLRYASAMAADCHASLTVVEVLVETAETAEEGVSSPDELESRMVENTRRRLEDLVAGLGENVAIQARVLIGRVHQEIVREVFANGHDLVLKPAQPASGLRQRLFGDDDMRLLKNCPCPVLLIRSIPPKPYRHRRICAGIYQDEKPGGQRDDRYGINRRILEHAARLASAQFAELHVILVWEAYGEQDLQSSFSPFQSDTGNYVEQELERNRKALDIMLAEQRESMESGLLQAFNLAHHMVKGSHRDEILRFAANLPADLVVVGTAARGSISDYIVDSTATAITRQLKCSVLVVKPPEFTAAVSDAGF